MGLIGAASQPPFPSSHTAEGHLRCRGALVLLLLPPLPLPHSEGGSILPLPHRCLMNWQGAGEDLHGEVFSCQRWR